MGQLIIGQRAGKNLSYLAVPYTVLEMVGVEEAGKEASCIRAERFRLANKVAGFLLQQGFKVYSPISHTHSIAMDCKLPIDQKFWAPYNELILGCCDIFFVLKIAGWKESKGLKAEYALAKKFGMQIIFLKLVSKETGTVQLDKEPGDEEALTEKPKK